MDGPVPGDSGSWVVDADSGRLYGQIVGGRPDSSVAYVLPARTIFTDIETRGNCEVAIFSGCDGSVLLSHNCTCDPISLHTHLGTTSSNPDKHSDASRRNSSTHLEVELSIQRRAIQDFIVDPRDKADHESPIQDFLTWVRASYSLEIIDSDQEPFTTRSFIPVNKIRKHLQGQRLRDILVTLFPNNDELPEPEDILPDYVAIFTILLQLSKGRYIKYFRRYNSLNDVHLPFDPRNPPPHWPEDDDDQEFLVKFCTRQWAFCATEFGTNMIDKFFDKSAVIPVIQKTTLASGASGKISKIELDPRYNRILPESTEAVCLRLSSIFLPS